MVSEPLPKAVMELRSRAKVVLSSNKPRNNRWGIELITITNQTAMIRIIKTGEIVSANKGNRFECQSYKGLYLVNISGDKREVELAIVSSAFLPAIKGITY